MIALRIAVATLMTMLGISAWAQLQREVIPSTTVLEMSPELGAEYHRIHGKLEALVLDKALAQELSDRFITWFEASGSEKPMTFEEAQADLMAKLKGANQDLDESRRAGTISTWLMPHGSQISQAEPAKPEQQTGANDSSKPDAAAVIVEPKSDSATQTAESRALDQTPALKTTKEEPSEWQMVLRLVFMAVVTLVVSLLAFKLHPKLIETSAHRFSRPAWRRFVARLETTIIAGGVGAFLSSVFAELLI